MSFEIRKNIPKPKTVHKKSRQTMYPIAEMEIGDSFLISSTGTTSDKNRANGVIQTAHKQFPERKFSQRVDESGGVGIWRDADLAVPRSK